MSQSRHQPIEHLEDRLGLKIAARLSDGSDAVPHDIGERLRHARMQALARRKPERRPAADIVLSSGSGAVLGQAGQEPRWWPRMLSVVPMLALVVGLVAIDQAMDDKAAREVAKVDAALLLDDLPPAAYTDPGFLQFLRVNRAEAR